MTLDNPRLTYANHALEQSLDALERTIAECDSRQQHVDRSWRQIDTSMKALGRNWDWAQHSTYRKLHTKHATLQKQLRKAQVAYSTAHEGFEIARRDYDNARSSLALQSQQTVAENTALRRAQGGLGRAFESLSERLKTLTAPAAASAGYTVAEGAYDYIPFDVPSFLSQLVRLDELLAEDVDYAQPGARYRPVSLVEVGCGPGKNLLIARESRVISLSSVTGFEINPDQVAQGQRAFGLVGELQVADAMTFDYSAFDIVYCFRPFSDADMLAALEARIARSMRPNAYLLAPLSYDLSLYHALQPVPGARDTWKKTG